MNSTKKIIYWHQSGLSVYFVNKKLSVVLEKEVESDDIERIKDELNYLKGQKISLLLADSVSYLYEKTIDPPLPVDINFKNKLLEIIASDIPEDFSQFNWDFKVKSDLEGKQKVIVFAPIKKIQDIIIQISNDLAIEFDIIEPETIASLRDPNPILGIFKKTDIKGKDEDVLNLVLTPSQKGSKKSIPKIILILVFIIILIFSIFFIIKFKKPFSRITTISTPTPSPTSIPTPTSIPAPIIKEWSDLIVMVENGTTKSGLASKTAAILKNSGINQVDVGNADSTDYTSSKLIFKDISLKETYQAKFKELIKINDNNITIDNSITYDVVLIISIN